MVRRRAADGGLAWARHVRAAAEAEATGDGVAAKPVEWARTWTSTEHAKRTDQRPEGTQPNKTPETLWRQNKVAAAIMAVDTFVQYCRLLLKCVLLLLLFAL